MTPFVNTVERIVKAAGKWDDYLSEDHFHMRINNSPYMDLVIESWRCGSHPEDLGARHTSVAHYYEQNGDLIPDPDVVIDTGTGAPIEISQWCGTCRARWWDEDRGCGVVNPRQDKDIRTFLNVWSRNLKAQGFIAAAKNGGAS